MHGLTTILGLHYFAWQRCWQSMQTPCFFPPTACPGDRYLQLVRRLPWRGV